jgi:hypothetical protein
VYQKGDGGAPVGRGVWGLVDGTVLDSVRRPGKNLVD